MKISNSSDARILRFLQYFILISIVLYFARDVLIPISFAILISFVLYPVCKWLEKKGIPRLASIVISLLFVLVIFVGCGALLINQLFSFTKEWPLMQQEIVSSFRQLSDYFRQPELSTWNEQRIVDEILHLLGNAFIKFVSYVFQSSAMSAILLIMTPVYSVLILYYRKYWFYVLSKFFPGARQTDLRRLILETTTAYYRFIKGVAIVYLIVGTLNSVGLLLLGIPHAIFFGFAASILTFIPYIGIIVGAILPIIISWILNHTIWYPLGVIGVFTFVQYLEANIIFPFAVSNRLGVNPMVMLVAIVFGGLLWGLSGMILFVPFIGILKLIADHQPQWKMLSLVLGNDITR